MKVWGIAYVSVGVAAIVLLVLLAIGRDLAEAASSAIAGGIGVAFFLGIVRARRTSRG